VLGVAPGSVRDSQDVRTQPRVGSVQYRSNTRR
jgi:hypothetical protein